MSEQDRQQRRRSPLESERGSTNIKDSVVSKIAGMAAGEVEGIRMGGSASRAATGVLEGVMGSQSQTRGVSVEVGRIEAAIDVTMGVEYGRNMLLLAERVRNRITERVENLTGLRVTELNVTIGDVVFTEGDRRERRRDELESEPGEEDRPQVGRTEEMRTGSREREAMDTEPIDLGAARSEAITRAGSSFSEETTRAEDRPPEEDQTAELRLDDEETERIRRRDRRRRR